VGGAVSSHTMISGGDTHDPGRKDVEIQVDGPYRLLPAKSHVKIICDIQLFDTPIGGDINKEDCVNGGGLDHQPEGVSIVNPGLLVKSFGDQSGLVLVYRAI